MCMFKKGGYIVKKTLLFLSVVLLMIGLSACGSDTNSSNEADNKNNNVSAGENEDNTEKKEKQRLSEKKKEVTGTEASTTSDSIEESDIYSDDVKDLIGKFNSLATHDENVDLIENVEPAEEKGDGYSQTLFSSSEYIISTLYDYEGNEECCIVVIPASEPYQELKGNGLAATLNVAESLNFDTEEFMDEFEKALPSHNGIYFTDDYTVTFSTNDNIPEMGIITMFINVSFSE